MDLSFFQKDGLGFIDIFFFSLAYAKWHSFAVVTIVVAVSLPILMKAELPVEIVTAYIGVPMFLYLLIINKTLAAYDGRR